MVGGERHNLLSTGATLSGWWGDFDPRFPTNLYRHPNTYKPMWNPPKYIKNIFSGGVSTPRESYDIFFFGTIWIFTGVINLFSYI